jgi:hypothetical protein
MVKVRSSVRVLAVALLGLLLLAAALFTFAGGWYFVPRARHFRRAVKTADFTAVARSASEVIRKSGAGQGADYHGNTLTNLPKPIADLEPEDVSVSEGGMVISFVHGAEGFGLKIIDGSDELVIFSYPFRPESQLVELSFKKDPKTGELVGPANRSQPVRSETNSPSAAAGSGR